MSIYKLHTNGDEYSAHDSFVAFKDFYSDETIMSYKDSQTAMNNAS